MKAWPKDKPFDHLPTFEQLQQRSGLKVHKLRVALKGVEQWKCSDNTVRYDDAEARDALEDCQAPAPELDETQASIDGALSADPVAASLQITQRALGLLATVVKERGEIVKACTDVIRTMGEPQKLGIEMVKDANTQVSARLKHYDEIHLDMVTLLEELHQHKADREHQVAVRKDRAEMRKESLELAKKYLPDALGKFQLTTEASLALELLRSLDPDAVAPIVELAVPEEMQPKARKLLDMLRARRQQARNDNAAKPSVDTQGESAKESNDNATAATEAPPAA